MRIKKLHSVIALLIQFIRMKYFALILLLALVFVVHGDPEVVEEISRPDWELPLGTVAKKLSFRLRPPWFPLPFRGKREVSSNSNSTTNNRFTSLRNRFGRRNVTNFGFGRGRWSGFNQTRNGLFNETRLGLNCTGIARNRFNGKPIGGWRACRRINRNPFGTRWGNQANRTRFGGSEFRNGFNTTRFDRFRNRFNGTRIRDFFTRPFSRNNLADSNITVAFWPPKVYPPWPKREIRSVNDLETSETLEVQRVPRPVAPNPRPEFPKHSLPRRPVG